MGLDHICEGFDIKFMASRNANAPNVVLNDMSLETALWQNGVLVSQITNELVEDEVRPTLAGSTGSQRRVAVATSIRGTNSLKSCVLTSPGSTKEVQILQTLCIKAQPICFIVYDVEQGLTPAAALVGLKRCGPLDLSSLLTSRDWRLHTATSSSPPVPGDAYPWFADPGAVECASAPDGDVHARPSCPHVNDGDLGRRKNENGSSVTRQPNPASAPSPVTSEPLRSGADEDLPTSEWNEDTQARPARIHISDAGLRRRVSWATWQSHPDFPPSPAQLGSSLPKAHYPLVSAGAPFDRDRLLEFDVETEEYEQLLGPRSPLLNFTDTINQQFVQGLEEGSSRRTTVVGSWESREPDPPVLPSPAEPCRIPLPPSP
ncbi:hypothetical protein GLOTRDRAFT_139025 [Gloeophyllum trabeum ATCC 11539]|uniref:Uncharacterized protein n=1 Tax=Gloeophyllum trabeum (strain ATCC 11539 / FP-39264 / Madison 617) TaxID=670483 RepID=S7Q347_GLOTA|nr:uncharacterized protein GLOTRDRAFT_139025 [Gloeophyllum trabeum ATCC 11539]EPQ54436.1 hypothetical protein GLOTRDRAFT_139025 [Gloeophyllum trabeum ATCC 11539]